MPVANGREVAFPSYAGGSYYNFLTRDGEVATSGANHGNLKPASSGSTGHAASCPSCHGRIPPPFPVAPIGNAFFRDIIGRGSGGGREPKKDYPQCHMQYDRDHETCGRQPSNRSRGVCRESAGERYRYCLRYEGELGFPSLRIERP